MLLILIMVNMFFFWNFCKESLSFVERKMCPKFKIQSCLKKEFVYLL